jgi:hypothetical protein
MASFEGIRSPFPAQPSARSPKLRFYESLFLWNQGIDQLVATLRGMEKFPFVRKSVLQAAQVEIEEVRADLNADFMEELADRELDDAGRFWKQRRAYERQREDADDVYLAVERREQQRKEQGLPPRIGIVPYSAVADEEKRIEEEREQKKQPLRKRSKPTVSTKRRVRGQGHD